VASYRYRFDEAGDAFSSNSPGQLLSFYAKQLRVSLGAECGLPTGLSGERLLQRHGDMGQCRARVTLEGVEFEQLSADRGDTGCDGLLIEGAKAVASDLLRRIQGRVTVDATSKRFDTLRDQTVDLAPWEAAGRP